LSLAEAVQPGALDGTDVDEYILAAVSRLNEAKSLLAVEPLYSSFWHMTLLSQIVCRFCVCGDRACAWPISIRVLGKSSVRRKARGEAKSFRPKLDVRNIRVYLPDDKEFPRGLGLQRSGRRKRY
jgi:hypothetical protein